MSGEISDEKSTGAATEPLKDESDVKDLMECPSDLDRVCCHVSKSVTTLAENYEMSTPKPYQIDSQDTSEIKEHMPHDISDLATQKYPSDDEKENDVTDIAATQKYPSDNEESGSFEKIYQEDGPEFTEDSQLNTAVKKATIDKDGEGLKRYNVRPLGITQGENSMF